MRKEMEFTLPYTDVYKIINQPVINIKTGRGYFEVQLNVKTSDSEFCQRLKALMSDIIEVCEGKEMGWKGIK